jgi:gamma-glutamylcyclotransferase (GGCT)/AIG2-like uncharacterized protein YtfP
MAAMEPPQDREKLFEAVFSANATRFISRDHILEELPMALVVLGHWTESDRSLPVEQLEERLDDLLGRPSRRLAVYGSLRPGRENFHLVADLRGKWQRGHVRGVLEPGGGEGNARWPKLSEHEGAPEVAVDVLESDDLPARWVTLDEFESPAYQRQLIVVELAEGRLAVANLYSKAFHP